MSWMFKRCPHCDSLVPTYSKWKKRKCPKCGTKFNVQNSKNYGECRPPNQRYHLINHAKRGLPIILARGD